jgi:hypothetical protein
VQGQHNHVPEAANPTAKEKRLFGPQHVFGVVLGAGLGVSMSIALGNMAFMSVGTGGGIVVGLSMGAALKYRGKQPDE